MAILIHQDTLKNKHFIPLDIVVMDLPYDNVSFSFFSVKFSKALFVSFDLIIPIVLLLPLYLPS